MRKNKIFPVAFIVAIFICGVVWYGNIGRDNAVPQKGSSSSATWTEYFSTVSDMEAASDIGIIGVLSDSTTELRKNVVFTRNIVEVVAVHSGDILVGDFVEVLQTGGEYGGISTPAFSEAPLMETGKEYAMFLKETTPHEKYGQYYLIAGGYLGYAEIPVTATPWTRDETVEFTDYFANNFN